MKYQKVPDRDIAWVKFQECAFDRAAEDYALYSEVDFADEVYDYLRNGFVVVQPEVFALARPIEWEGRRGWLIRYARGDLTALLRVLPCPLEFIAFCRNSDGVLRIVNWGAFVAKTLATKKG